MNDDECKSILRDAEGAGPHQCSRLDVGRVRDAAGALGYSYARIALEAPVTRESFFRALQRELDFPQRFRHDWSSMVECLTDLGWRRAPGHVLVIEGFEQWANTEGVQFDTALSCFGEVSEYWREDDIAMWSLFVVDDGERQFLPRL